MNPRSPHPRFLWAALAFFACAAPVIAASAHRPTTHARPAPVRFNRDIRPILAANCFLCHGFDKNKRVGGLRLDIPDEAVARGVIVPGKPEKSRLISRILATDARRRMPPVSTHKQLTAQQKALLRRWIAEGARYERHWAFVPLPARVPTPAVKNAAWCRNEIDRFVLARLDAEGLRPSPEASRETWLRRVSLDLTGLPPAPREIDEFVADRSTGAYEKVVDRLLASPRYGERMAQPWLDVARYADSYGYQSDQLCLTWPYRDWVVRAFNENLPYDQFITQQIAGDLLGKETQLPTAFNRLHRMTNEGGSASEEWRLEGVADRVKTFGTAFLGLTFECARCHDHKYDPITQRDFYALSGFFNSIDEYGLYDRADIVPAPSMLLPTPEQAKQLAEALDAVRHAEQALAKARSDGEAAFLAWFGKQPRDAAPVLADLAGHFDFEAFEGAVLKNLAPGAAKHGARSDEVPLVPGRFGKAAQLDGENNVNFPDLGRFTRHTPFTLSFWIYDPRLAAEPAVIFQASSGTDTGPHGLDLLLERGVLTARIFRHWPGNAIAVRAALPVRKEAWTHVAVTYDGSSRAAGLRIYVDGAASAHEVVRDRIHKGTGQHVLIFGQRFRDKGFKGGRLDELRSFNRALSPLEVAALNRPQSFAEAFRHAEAAPELRDYYFSAIHPETRAAAAALAAARQRVVAAEDAQTEIAVMEEMPAPRLSYVLARGQYDAPRTAEDLVERSTPAAIAPFPGGLRRDRLGLALWMTRPDHPLTARVAVNRFWTLLFGKGIVETVEDFGTQGRLPSHPELLDWLAIAFANGRMGEWGNGRPDVTHSPTHPLTHSSPWNVKALLRLIVLSSTYRQSSALRPELLRRDPNNELLARGPSGRLSAEAVRDLALAASGLLDERMGGPPVSPYQPGDLWRESNSMSPAYRQSTGTDLYRRSLYTVIKRTAPMPNMSAFDALSREVCVARRQPTNTPLQALVLLNDPQFVEAARVLGERTLREAGSDPASRVRHAFKLLASREPTPEELPLLVGLYERHCAEYTKEPEQAAKLLKVGERKPDATLPPAEVAAATALAQVILNLDAAIWKR